MLIVLPINTLHCSALIMDGGVGGMGGMGTYGWGCGWQIQDGGERYG